MYSSLHSLQALDLPLYVQFSPTDQSQTTSPIMTSSLVMPIASNYLLVATASLNLPMSDHNPFAANHLTCRPAHLNDYVVTFA